MAINANVKIVIGVKSTRRDNTQPFRPTTIVGEAWEYNTTLDTYLNDTDDISATIYNYIASQRIDGWENTTHYSVRVDNITHPTVAAGVIKLPKGHLDGALSDLEFQSGESLRGLLNNAIADLRVVGKYA